MKLKPKTIIAKRYEVIELIGVGGTANVYCANDLKLERKVSLKVLKEEFVDTDFIQKFSKEAKSAAKISHINIANVYDVGNDGDIYYIIMEYVDGYTLKEIIKSKAPFTNEEVLGISIQMANALEVAHKKGIVHRDIKPENILVTKEGTIKITDFGIARATSSNTITTDTMGSVHYFSPEQATGSYVDFKSDIYSLGIIMYEMITGKRPFDGEGVVQLAMKHVNDPLPSMKNINKNISDSLEKVILKATAKKQDSRYSSAKELNIDLKKALSDDTGIFVKENNYLENLPTIMIKPEEIEEINKRIQKENKTSISEKTEPIENTINSYNDNDDSIDENLDTNDNFEKTTKSKERKVTFFAILTSFVVIIFISTFLFVWFSGKNIVTVPDFIDSSWEDAVAIAKEKKIYISNTKEEYSDTIKKGNIVSQEIKKGTEIDKGKTVNVAISLGDGKFTLDDFTGKDIVEVYKSVEDKEIFLKEEYQYDESVEIGKVISQNPKGGEKVKKGVEVTLYISRGKEDKLVPVPNVLGYDEASAKATIESAGLSVGKIRKTESDTVDAGKIVSQSVRAGSEVSENTQISLVISSGKKETTTEATTLPIVETTSETTSETTQETTDSVLKKDVLVINPITEDNKENVSVKVIKIVDGQSNIIWSNNHNISEFPLEITVFGDKPTQFELYIDGNLIGTETKNFD